MNQAEPFRKDGLGSEKLPEMATPSPEPLWTVEDVARYLRLEAETIRAMARRDELPAIKVGRVWRFRGEEIKIWGKRAIDEASKTAGATQNEPES